MGKIELVIHDTDNVIRGVKLTTHSKQGKLTTVYRPIQKIIPFEVTEDNPTTPTSTPITPSLPKPKAQSESKGDTLDDVANRSTRSRRRAAIIGEQTRRVRSKFS